MKKIILIAMLLGILIISGCNNQGMEEDNNLPDSFTIKIYGDYTSSAASRNYQAELVFQDNLIVSGVQEHSSSDTFGNEISQVCRLNTQTNSWLNENGVGSCEYIDSNILTKEYIQNKIINGENVQPNEYGCPHYNTCYEILD